MKIILSLSFVLLLISCGGGGGSGSNNNPPDNTPPVKVNKYSDDEAIMLFASAATLAEGAIEVSQLIESEFTYLAYAKAPTSFRPCQETGKVHWNYSGTIADSGQIKFVFENCRIAPYKNDIFELESFIYEGEVTVNYEILERTETLINGYELPGLANFKLGISSADFRVVTEEGEVSIAFDFDTSIDQIWNFDENSEVQQGELVRTIEVAEFLAPLLTENFDRLSNAVISQTQLPDQSFNSGKTYTGDIEGLYVSSLDNTQWQLKSKLRVVPSSDSLSGIIAIATDEESVNAAISFDYMEIGYNSKLIGAAYFHEVFEESLRDTPTTWELMTFLRTRVPLIAIDNNLSQELVSNGMDDIQLEFSANLSESSLWFSDFADAYYYDIDHSLFENVLSFPSSSLPSSDLLTINMYLNSQHVGEPVDFKFGIDRQGRGSFVWLPEALSYIPGHNKFFGAENFKMYLYDIDGTRVHSKDITSIERGVCTSAGSGNLFMSDDNTDKLLEFNPENLQIIAGYPQPSFNLINHDRSSYCADKYYRRNGNSTDGKVMEYDFANKTEKEIFLETTKSDLLIIPHPSLSDAVISAQFDKYFDKDYLEVEVFSTQGSSMVKQSHGAEDDQACRYLDSNSIFLQAQASTSRLYACNYVLDLDNLSNVIHRFDGGTGTEYILYVEPDFDLIVTNHAVYNGTTFEVLMDLSFLNIRSWANVMKANQALYVEQQNFMYFVLDLQQFSSN